MLDALHHDLVVISLPGQMLHFRKPRRGTQKDQGHPGGCPAHSVPETRGDLGGRTLWCSDPEMQWAVKLPACMRPLTSVTWEAAP